MSVRDGDPKLVTHLRRERNRRLVEAKKIQFRTKHGKLFCEGCSADHAIYGSLTDALFEVHHRTALGAAAKAVKTSLNDLAVLCSNCHRVIHRSKPMMSVSALNKRLR